MSPFPTTSDPAALLELASVELDKNDVQAARTMAEAALRAADAAQQREQQANAFSLLAHCDRLTSQLRSAIDHGQQAAHLYRSLKDLRGETLSLATICFAASCLGRYEDAVEAGLLCIRLSEKSEGGKHQAIAYNNLGIALFCSQRFDEAIAALRVAERLARSEGSSASPAQPLLNMVCAESFRLLAHRHCAGEEPDPRLLIGLVDEHVAAAQGKGHALQAGMNPVVAKTSRTFEALAQCWAGNTDGALQLLRKTRDLPSTNLALTWIGSVEALTRMEVARRLGQIEAALAFASTMVEVATACQHEHLACLGHMAAAELYMKNIEPELAARELMFLRQREQAIRAESIRSRERAVNMQIEARALAHSVEQLTVDARMFERMCLEDALTGLSNRRSFDQELEGRMKFASSGEAPSVMAFVDVDRFKQVNDHHTHKVGDQVLRAVANLMTEAVDGRGRVYRLGSDEFCILFHTSTTEIVAAQCCRRIRDLAASFDWDSYSNGLRITLSIGTSVSKQDDTAHSWLDRCDTQMYRVKRGAKHGAEIASPWASSRR
jgi:diguanylate cyclase (GGDEF)-like protein